MLRQCTIKQSVSLTGVSITGEPKAQVAFCPAPPNTGIVIIRNDLAGGPRFECSFLRAKVDYRWTSLVFGDIRIEHTEHALAAIGGLGIDNLIIELEQPSFPVMDDYSSSLFTRALLKAGIIEQSFEAKRIQIARPIIIHKREKVDNKLIEKLAMAIPYEGFKLTYILDYPNLPEISQRFEMDINAETFINELAGARSFILDSEINQVVELTGNASANVLVVNASCNHKDWIWQNELARHKALDLLGDLTLLGEKLQGHIIGIRSGHRLNLELCKKIYRGEKNDSFS